MNSNPTLRDQPAILNKLRELTKDIRTAMVTTSAPDGALHSRPMATQKIEEDGVLWFFTADDSGKVAEMAVRRWVNVAYADPGKDRYVSVAGRALLVRDPVKAKELWSPWAKAYFPAGLEDPHLALLCVDIESAAYWDVKESKMVQLLKMAKAIATHETPKLGEHGKMDMPPPKMS